MARKPMNWNVGKKSTDGLFDSYYNVHAQLNPTWLNLQCMLFNYIVGKQKKLKFKKTYPMDISTKCNANEFQGKSSRECNDRSNIENITKHSYENLLSKRGQ